MFTYGTAQGLPSLLHVLIRHLADYQVFTRPEHLMVTSGVQQALAILTTMPFPSGRDTVLLEQPSYHLFVRLLNCYGIPARGITRTEKGIDLNELEQLFQTGSIKLFYTIPRFHNPLGTSYTEDTKKAIAGLAKRYDVYIIEDDYLADLETNSKSDPIFAYGPSHVIYLKSYSKILFPGLRVGVAVLPHSLQPIFSSYKQLSDIDSAMLSQAALEIYIQSGMFERRKQRIVATYHNRMLQLNRALALYNDLDDIRPVPVQSGVHTHILLPDELQIPTLLNRLGKQQIVLKALDDSYLDGFAVRPMLKLSITQVREEQIEEGVSRIFDEIKRMRGMRTRR
ncbi:PLP-dependent aminotransferase family protein [Paenibacillus sepulcri]|uniref:PLP-dependent aminotransferase family protein n=1 Tax=Paenibacillus sepulcri TaxID=359917 RepID=A0ABS7CBQ1_9BACL|nr:PLP-dependent aminotransferase family protein [Paenibacillus sepulcri]